MNKRGWVKRSFFLRGLFVSVLLGLFPTVSLRAAEKPWHLKVDKAGIEVSTHQVQDSVMFEFQGKMVVEAPLREVQRVFEDIDLMTSWFYECTSARILRKLNDDQRIIHMTLRMPWPVADRDCIFQISRFVEEKTGGLRYEAIALPEELPPEPGKIRVPYLKGYWRFTPLANGRTEVYFQQHSEPGGSIPAFVANSLVVNMPYHSLKGLRSLVLKKNER